MKTEPKQGVSKFTEKDLTPNSAHSFTEGSDIGPLETHVQSELEKIQAGHEGYKMVPVELWRKIIWALASGRHQERVWVLTKMKSL